MRTHTHQYEKEAIERAPGDILVSFVCIHCSKRETFNTKAEETEP